MKLSVLALTMMLFVGNVWAGPSISCTYTQKPTAYASECGGGNCGKAYICVGVGECINNLVSNEADRELGLKRISCPANVVYLKGGCAPNEKCMGTGPQVSCPSATDCANDRSLEAIENAPVAEDATPDPSLVRPLGNGGGI